MKKLLIATNNKGKLAEMRAILSGVCDEIVSLEDMGLDVSPEETGRTFEENAIIKAKAGRLASALPCIADDSGICAQALNGAPGVFSARFAGPDATDADNNAKLVKYLSAFDEEDRKVWYACSIALALPGGRVLTACGECKGVFQLTPAGENGFGYDPYFYLPEYGKTMAQLEPGVKNTISHRYRALTAMRKLMEEL